MKKQKVAVVDNQLNKIILRELTGKEPCFSLSVESNVVAATPDCSENISHGTVCAAVFLEYAPLCETFFISIADEHGAMPISNMAMALNWCLANKIDLACMSIGSESWWDLQKLASVVNRFKHSGTLLVAAASNTGKITYPAALPEFIGVRHCGNLQPGQMARVINAKDGIDIVAHLPNCAVMQKLESKYNFPRITANSLTAPYLSAQILRTMLLFDNKRNVIDELGIPEYKSETEPAPLKNDSIDIPIIGVVDCDVNFALRINDAFLTDEYVSALLTPRHKSDFYENVFHLKYGSEYKDILEFLEIINADIVFIDMHGIADNRVHNLLDKEVTSHVSIAETFRDIVDSFEDGRKQEAD